MRFHRSEGSLYTLHYCYLSSDRIISSLIIARLWQCDRGYQYSVGSRALPRSPPQLRPLEAISNFNALVDGSVGPKNATIHTTP